MILRTIRRLCPRLLRSQAGTAMVEFALTAPAFLFMFMGIVELGRYATYAVLAQASARAGANYGAYNLMTADDLNGINTWATGDAQYLPTPITVTYKHLCSVGGVLPPVACSWNQLTAPTNTVYYIQVIVSAQYAPWVSYPGIPPSVTVTGSDYLRVQQQ
ncbi:MAG: TadE/TadG family type IV pilus assembly protein [Candidatus Cybelea sp.]